VAVGLWVSALGIAVGRFTGFADRGWQVAMLSVPVATALIAALIWTWRTRPNRLSAAAEIDRRFSLEERVASSLALDADERHTPMGEALLADASARVEYLDIGERFSARPPGRSVWPILPAAFALGLALALGAGNEAPQALADHEETQQVRQSAERLAAQLKETRRDAREAGLLQTAELLEQLEQGSRLLAQRDGTDRRQGMMALNDLVKQAEARREQLAGSRALRDQLERLKGLDHGPAERLGAAVKNGDMKAATSELARLGKRLKNNEMNERDREQLAAQLEQAQQALAKAVDAHRQAKRELTERLARAEQAGDVAETNRLEQQLDRLSQQDQHIGRLAEIAENLQDASRQAAAGNTRQAAEALERVSAEISATERELTELETLDMAQSELAQCKNAMACGACQGKGCALCQGGDHELPLARSQGGPPGKAPGRGDIDERQAKAGYYDSRAPQQVRRGASVVSGTADGPNRKGDVLEQIRGEYQQAAQRPAEALSQQRLPRDYRDHARGYFDALREGRP
jgi:hypothetical protein